MTLNVPPPIKPRILVIDDERFNLNTLHGLLRDEYRLMVAMQGEHGIKAAQTGLPDLILLDVNMPGMDGFEVCRQLKADPITQSIPVIFITALNEASDEAKGLELGAVDYITKPFNYSVVKARVRTHLRLKLQSDLLERYAFIDSLTGLANRRAFDERLSQEWSRCQRSETSLSLILLDVDHFKSYNDHYGHGQGDACLTTVARALASSQMRAYDLVARYGGEEFVVILPDADLIGAQQIAERLRLAVYDLAHPHATSPVADRVTISLGVACTVPQTSATAAQLLRAADRFLYEAKRAGRNRVHVSAMEG
jgi:diguanylate cyclase (GGDEF)-like protein